METVPEKKKAQAKPNGLGKAPFFSPSPVQTKLEVNLPGDKFEVETDQVAEHIVQKISDTHSDSASTYQTTPIRRTESISQSRVSNPLPTSPPKNPAPNHIQTKCEACDAEEKENPKEEEIQRKVDSGVFLQAAGTDEDEDPSLMTKRGSAAAPVVSAGTAAQLFASKGGGDPLQKNTQAEMEQGFGVDFSRVRIHTCPPAAKMSKNLGAQAFTHGSDIYFNQGKFDTQSKEGKRLLAHELTHVVQQGNRETIKRAADVSQLDPEMSFEPNTDSSLEQENVSNSEQGRFIVDDETIPGEGQMQKTAFLEVLNDTICKTVDKGLEETEYKADTCPYIRASFSKHRSSSPQYIEKLIERYSGVTTTAKNASELILQMQVRVMEAVQTWLKSGDMSQVPQEIQSEIYASMSEEVKGRIQRKLKGLAKPLFKAKEGGASTAKSAQEVMMQLGKGKSLETHSRNKMELAFGTDFSGVKIHTDNKAAALTNEMNAKAFNVGNHIVFGNGEHKPGSIIGDALMAHELAHVVQQRHSSGNINYQYGADDKAFEQDANQTAFGVVASILGKKQGIMPRLKSGLAIRSCCRDDMSQDELDQLGPILEESLVIMNGIDPAIVNSRFNYFFKGRNKGKLAEYVLHTSFSTKVLKYPSGKEIEWEKDIQVVSGYGYAAASDASPILNETGAYEFTFDLEVIGDNNSTIGVVNLFRTFNVETIRSKSDKAFAKIEDKSYDRFRSSLTEQSAILEPDNTPVNPSDTHIKSSSPNPAKSGPEGTAANLGYQVANDSTGRQYQWYLRPIQWDNMPDNVGSYSVVEKDGVKFYDLGTGSSASWPAIHPNIYVVVCKRSEDIGQGAKRQLEDLVYLQTILSEEALTELADFKKYSAQVDSLSQNISGEKVQVKALHVNKENGQVIPLQLFVGKNAKGEGYVLVDMTAGLDPSDYKLVYYGKTTAELKNNFKDDNKYPEGEIKIEFPANSIGLDKGGWYLETTGTTIWTALSGGLGIASFLLAVGAIVAAPFTKGGSLIVGGLILGSAVTGVAAGTFSIIDNLKNEQLSKTKMAIDVGGIVASIIGGAAAVRAARAGGNAVLLANSTTKFLLMGNLGVAAVSTFLISIDGVAQIDKILSNTKLTRDQQVTAITRVVANLILTGAMLYLAHKDMKAIKTRVNSKIDVSLGNTLKDEEHFLLVLLDDNTLGKLSASAGAKTDDLKRLSKVIREDPSFIQRAATHSDNLLAALKSAGGDTVEHLEKAILRVRLEGLGLKTTEADKFITLVNKAGLKTIELNLLDDAFIGKIKNPDVIRELELTMPIKEAGKIKGLDQWLRFNGPKAPKEITEALVELREARRLSNENPGSVIRVAKEMEAPPRPGKVGETMQEFDISINSSSGNTERSIEIKSVEKPVTDAPDMSPGVKHASEKAASRIAESAPIKGNLDAIIEIELGVGTTKKSSGNLTVSPNGDVTLTTGSGKAIPKGNIFNDFVKQIPKIKDSALLSRVTVVDRVGTVIAVYENSATGWTRIK